MDKSPFSCYLIGDDHLLPQCAEILLEHGHTILGIISRLEEAEKLANKYHINHFDSLSLAETTLTTTSFDYLFSIINRSILPLNIIQRANKLAINFHNAPLPRYAGVHALSWAILNDEAEHGVTWHIMTDVVDGGDILKQAIFPIDPHETGLSLSLKCYEHALTTFDELIGDLGKQLIFPVPQNISQRTYYDFNQKPKNNGWVDWNDSACHIERLVRALDLGHYHHNRLASPKIKIGGDIFIVSRLHILDEPSKTPPGTLVEIHSDSWSIATKTSLVRIEQLHALDGRVFSLDKLTHDFNLQPGVRLPIPLKSQFENYKKISEACAKWELFWVQQLIDFNRTTLPFQPKYYHQESHHTTKQIARLKLSNTDILHWQTGWTCDAHSTDVLMTAVLIYLYRLGYPDRLGIGLKDSPKLDIDQSIKTFFAPVIPFSIEFTGDLTFSEALQLVRKQRDLVENRLTFAEDVFYRYPELSQLERDNYPIAILTGEKVPLKEQISVTKASVIITLSTDTNEVAWWVVESLMIQEHNLIKIIQNSIESLRILLASLPTSDTLPISKLPMLHQQEREKILYEWNKTTTVYPKDKTLIQVFENQVLATPNNIAINYQKESLTYKELNQKANQLAHYLQKQGLLPQTFAAICTNQEIHLIIGILAILKTGAAYLPIDPNYPKQHIQFLLSDSQPKVLLASKKLCETIENDCIKQKIPVFLLETMAQCLDQEPTHNLPHIKIAPKSVAYIIYTSGTTGKPKGVMVPHQAVNRLVNNTNFIQISTTDRIAQAASISFDAATFEIWGALLNGATLIAIPHAILLDIEKFAIFIEKNAISILWLTSALFNQYAAKDPGLFKYLTYLLVGGDVLNQERIMSVLDCKDGSPRYILNGYGPTENTTFTTTHLITHKDKNLASIPIGKPISNTTVYVLDENLQPTPIGAIGELYTGGDGVALGYLNRSDLTQEKFIDNPFTKTKDTKLYKTGDKVRWMPDGNIEYLGRQDNQVKIRGFRIELEAIQAHLLHHHAISQCVVRASAQPNHTKILVAYLVCEFEVTDLELQTFLAQQLPVYMIPNFFVRLNKLPLTANGKVDCKKLPRVDTSARIRVTEYIAPTTPREKSLARLMSQLLGINEIGIDDNFFDLGGHSLLITQLILQLKDIYRADIQLHEFLENPTIRHLNQLIDGNYCVLDQHGKNRSLLADCILSDDIRVDGLDAIANPPKSILLTGASGFLGAHLLHDLHHATNAKIYCLVRENKNTNAESRINTTLNKYQLSLNCSERIIPIAGDLSLPNFGLSDALFSELAAEVDIIYHNGAAVNHLYNYDLLRATNVLSTIDIIKFATLTKLKPIHYVSTLSAASNHLDVEKNILEDFIPPGTQSLAPQDGYSQSKWISEQLLSTASSRGVPVNIYRPGWIMGHSHTGIIAAENNHLLLLIKGCIQLGSAPSWDVKLDILPVDRISQLIASISLDGKNTTRVYNMTNPNTIAWVDLIHYLNHRDYSVSLVEPDIWKEKYLQTINQDNALYALYALYVNSKDTDWMKGLSTISNANSHNTSSKLKQFNLQAPMINEQLLDTYFNFLIKQGFIPKISNKN